MHIPLVVAFLALLAFALLPVLDRPTGSERSAAGVCASLIRISVHIGGGRSKPPAGPAASPAEPVRHLNGKHYRDEQ